MQTTTKRSSKNRKRGNKARSALIGESKPFEKGVIASLNELRERPMPDTMDVVMIHPKRNRSFTMTCQQAVVVINTGAGASSAGVIFASLTQATGLSGFQAVFDMYRILAVQVRFNPIYTQVTFPTLATPTTTPTYLTTAIDYEDAVNPANSNALRQYESCQSVHFTQYLERTFTPRVPAAVYTNTTGLSTSVASLASPWLATSSPDVQHLGVKWVLDPAVGVTIQAYAATITAVFQFRNTI